MVSQVWSLYQSYNARKIPLALRIQWQSLSKELHFALNLFLTIYELCNFTILADTLMYFIHFGKKFQWGNRSSRANQAIPGREYNDRDKGLRFALYLFLMIYGLWIYAILQASLTYFIHFRMKFQSSNRSSLRTSQADMFWLELKKIL